MLAAMHGNVNDQGALKSGADLEMVTVNGYGHCSAFCCNEATRTVTDECGS